MKRSDGRPRTFWILAAVLPFASAAFFSNPIMGCGGEGGIDAGLINCGPGGVGNTNFEAREPFSLEVEVVNQTTFDMLGVGGEISITGALGSTSVIVSGIKSVQSESLEDAQAHLLDLNADLKAWANEIRLKTIRPQCNEGRIYNIDYTITLPPHFKTRVDHVGGRITLESLENDVVINHLSGNVALRNISGNAVVDLFTGDIDAEVTLPVNGTIDMRVWMGDIRLDIPETTSAEFSAVVSNGSISVSNLVLHGEINTPTFRSGTLGSGQGTIYLETEFQGDIGVSGI